MGRMTAGRVLVIEDDPKTRETIGLYLVREGFEAIPAADGPSGLSAARSSSPDLVVLDLMLPGLDGLAICRELRRTSAVPIIMVTARGTDEEVRRGLDLGADDYVTKPFSPRTLMARVRAVLRRTKDDAGPRAIQVGSIHIDRARHQATLAGTPLDLTPTEFRLLDTFAAAPGRVFSRPALIERAFGGEAEVLDRTVDAHVMNLRRKLRTAGKGPLIATVFAVGYRLEVEP